MGGVVVEKTKVYSPMQAGSGAFIFGPLAAVYFLWINFKALGQSVEAKRTLIWGLAGNVLVLAVLPFLPSKFPNVLIPLIFGLGVRFLAETLQLKKEAIAGSEQYTFRSNWSVFWIGLALLVAYVVVAISVFLALDALGIYTLPS